MSDFTLEPDEIEPARGGGRPVRLITTGLTPTAEVPMTRTKEPPACYAALCGLWPAGPHGADAGRDVPGARRDRAELVRALEPGGGPADLGAQSGVPGALVRVWGGGRSTTPTRRDPWISRIWGRWSAKSPRR